MNTESSSGSSDSTANRPETKVETVARLLRNKGGYLLVAGEVRDLGFRINNHPQIIIWDLVQSETRYYQKSIPSNVRGIFYNRHIGHQLVSNMRTAANKLGIPLFPMLTTKELKDVLNALMEHMEVSKTPFKDHIPDVEYFDKSDALRQLSSLQEREIPMQKESHEESKGSETQLKEEPLVEKVMTMRKVKRGETFEIFAEYLGTGKISEERKQLEKVFKSKGIDITPEAIAQAIHKYRKEKGLKTPKAKLLISSKPTKSANGNLEDRLANAEELLNNAQAAIVLFLELIPEIKAEVNRVKEKQAKLLELLS